MIGFHTTQPFAERYFQTDSSNISYVLQQDYYLHTTHEHVKFTSSLIFS